MNPSERIEELRIFSTLWVTPANPSERIEELRIFSTLWVTPAKLVNLLDFKPEKLSIKTENDKSSTIITHQVRYENGGFYLTIDNIKGYFSIVNNNVVLNMIFSNDDQKNKYHQVWKEIFKIVDNGNGELKLHPIIIYLMMK